ncbi:MAG: benzoyl-CoA-dihydrodiol lyase [Deltaproteobacteria bacterium]|nr:benzoyl-CoA-dihydrodiol lyase [Deltaproteobacteria bacterium]
MDSFSFCTHPSRYRHLRLETDRDVARITLAVREGEPFFPGHPLKLNSYDLGVDIELADAVQRLRFEHPEVKTVVITSDRDRVFCAGANIHMLAASPHSFKVNFCKFTNETRLAIEDASKGSGQKYLAAINGACAGGGYELALACDEILLIDDGSSAVSLPEVPLLGVLPGTGGLTRLVDKRKVRRDLADVFATVAEGVRGKRAVEWNLVDAIASKSKFADAMAERARKLAETVTVKKGPGIPLDDTVPVIEGDRLAYQHVTLDVDRARRTAELTIRAPEVPPPRLEGVTGQGAAFWPLRAWREVDDALLRLRFHFEEVGVILVRTRGDGERVLAYDRFLATHSDHWLASEVRLLMARVLRRMDATARSFFAIVDEGSCFFGSLCELLWASDRSYMLEDPHKKVRVQLSALNGGALPMGHGLSRLAQRYLAAPVRIEELLVRASGEALSARDAEHAGLVTIAMDEIDFSDEVRVAVEERASLSPDALTGMEANLRFAGPESTATKIFGRLSAWQNWIFVRDNATGDSGALTVYGGPERARFQWART